MSLLRIPILTFFLVLFAGASEVPVLNSVVFKEITEKMVYPEDYDSDKENALIIHSTKENYTSYGLSIPLSDWKKEIGKDSDSSPPAPWQAQADFILKFNSSGLPACLGEKVYYKALLDLQAKDYDLLLTFYVLRDMNLAIKINDRGYSKRLEPNIKEKPSTFCFVSREDAKRYFNRIAGIVQCNWVKGQDSTSLLINSVDVYPYKFEGENIRIDGCEEAVSKDDLDVQKNISQRLDRILHTIHSFSKSISIVDEIRVDGNTIPSPVLSLLTSWFNEKKLKFTKDEGYKDLTSFPIAYSKPHGQEDEIKSAMFPWMDEVPNLDPITFQDIIGKMVFPEDYGCTKEQTLKRYPFKEKIATYGLFMALSEWKEEIFRDSSLPAPWEDQMDFILKFNELGFPAGPGEKIYHKALVDIQAKDYDLLLTFYVFKDINLPIKISKWGFSKRLEPNIKEKPSTSYYVSGEECKKYFRRIAGIAQCTWCKGKNSDSLLIDNIQIYPYKFEGENIRIDGCDGILPKEDTEFQENITQRLRKVYNVLGSFAMNIAHVEDMRLNGDTIPLPILTLLTTAFTDDKANFTKMEDTDNTYRLPITYPELDEGDIEVGSDLS